MKTNKEIGEERMAPQKKFDAENFQQEVIETSKSALVLVHFYAPWCGPCCTQQHHLNSVAGHIGDRAVFGELHVEESNENYRLSAGDFHIRSIPTVIFFRNGEEIFRTTGCTSSDFIIDKIKKILKN